MGRLKQQRSAARQPRAVGFTLVEILVALATVAIASGAAWLAWRAGGESSLRREADRFAGAIEYAAQRAQWRHEDLAVSVDARGWRFWRRDPDRREWIPVANDDVLAPRTLPDGVAFTAVTIAGRPVPPGASVPFRASGRNDPSSFVLASEGARLDVLADPLNRVAVAAVER